MARAGAPGVAFVRVVQPLVLPLPRPAPRVLPVLREPPAPRVASLRRARRVRVEQRQRRRRLVADVLRVADEVAHPQGARPQVVGARVRVRPVVEPQPQLRQVAHVVPEVGHVRDEEEVDGRAGRAARGAHVALVRRVAVRRAVRVSRAARAVRADAVGAVAVVAVLVAEGPRGPGAVAEQIARRPSVSPPLARLPPPSSRARAPRPSLWPQDPSSASPARKVKPRPLNRVGRTGPEAERECSRLGTAGPRAGW